MLTKGVSCRPHPCHKGTQTDIPSTPALLPITLPMFMPVPMQMYCRPYPVPVRIDLLYDTLPLETVQDSLIKLDIKPLIYLFEIGIFSIDDVILRLTKIMNRANKNWAHF